MPICGEMEHFARDCSRKRKGKGERARRRQGICRRKKESEERFRQIGSIQENRNVGDTKDSGGRAASSDTRHQEVDEESPTSMSEMQTAEKAKNNLNQKKMEKSEECGSSGMWRDQGR